MVSRRVFAQLLLAPLLTVDARARAALAAIETDRRTLRSPSGRTIEIFVWRPVQAPRGRVHFFHGAASAPWKYTALLEPLCALGFEIHAPLHVDSTDHPQTQQYAGLRSWAARLEDAALLDAQAAERYHAVPSGVQVRLIAMLSGPVRGSVTHAPGEISAPFSTPGLAIASSQNALYVRELIQSARRRSVPLGRGFRTIREVNEAVAQVGRRGYALGFNLRADGWAMLAWPIVVAENPRRPGALAIGLPVTDLRRKQEEIVKTVSRLLAPHHIAR